MEGGSANDHDYCSGDPVNCMDTSGLHPLGGDPEHDQEVDGTQAGEGTRGAQQDRQGQRPVVIGASMSRVVPAARALNADTILTTRGATWVTRFLVRAWIRRLIDEGRVIYDIGPDGYYAGPFYRIELEEVRRAKYPTVPYPWPSSGQYDDPPERN